MFDSNSVKKATSINSLKAINRRLVLVSSVIVAGGPPLGRDPWACFSIAIS